MPSRPSSGGEDGLSLVEMMIAVLLLGFILSALANVLVTTLQAVRGQESTTQATAAVNDILEEAQRIDYDAAALCDTTATAHFGASTFEGEDLVLSPAVCGAPDEVPVTQTVTRDGRDYVVQTAITWADDPADGTGSTDADSPQDVKRVVVDITWEQDGRTRSDRNMGFRAPQFLEQLISGEVEPADGEFVTIYDKSATEQGWNGEAFTLRVYARERLSSVYVSWQDRNGNTDSPHNMSQVDADGLVWEHDVPANFGPFANGGTLFDFNATSTTGETEQIVTRGLFLYDPMQVLGSSGRNFSTLAIGPDGAVCPNQSIWIDVEGAIRSDVAEAEWTKEPTTTIDTMVPVDVSADVALRGARFQLDLAGRSDFAVYDADDDEYDARNVTQVRMAVTRIVDDTTIDASITNFPTQVVAACPA